jgi:hypothetical protein
VVALAGGIVSPDEAALLRRAKRLTEAVVQVDDFPSDLGASDTVAQPAKRRAAA